ncbi:hypothetical protein Pcinc_018900 [Petrolisthes cinctipes]|uniref:Uncharacterized protein n=1 Tax=Petrolisthes cinctipes TaxID=88211 RepID=A0AAE1KLV5_PETCI|nr:hypothetical protein Pcinc_018900 [Petrolisthes cinctipes]
MAGRQFIVRASNPFSHLNLHLDYPEDADALTGDLNQRAGGTRLVKTATRMSSDVTSPLPPLARRRLKNLAPPLGARIPAPPIQYAFHQSLLKPRHSSTPTTNHNGTRNANN